MISTNYLEVEEFFNGRIANFQKLETDLKVALVEAYETYNKNGITETQHAKQRISELEEQLHIFKERIRVLEKLKKEQLHELDPKK